ncbi:hypothetical protein GF339_06160 [candidate division KSB3 bacterium]|uniref:Uncharacterized protein n=1 Tax=candidate division KSB3 bacterium TaxID=2044937 RepID=A0A9D5Q5B6_9BACT|nr:hypothetical protein [candidate division KSB3 bacterium]MBD3324148.1 hypothetical protein [candidate division KSB3 bacterium]
MNLKIHQQVERLRLLLDKYHEDMLEDIRDESLILADNIEEYIYQRDAQRIVEEFIQETKEVLEQ